MINTYRCFQGPRETAQKTVEPKPESSKNDIVTPNQTAAAPSSPNLPVESDGGAVSNDGLYSAYVFFFFNDSHVSFTSEKFL